MIFRALHRHFRHAPTLMSKQPQQLPSADFSSLVGDLTTLIHSMIALQFYPAVCWDKDVQALETEHCVRHIRN